MPEPGADEETMQPNNWLYVADNDIFPEEFIKFLSMDTGLRSVFLKVHGELMTANYWRDIKTQHLAGKISLVVPYRSPAMLERRTGNLKKTA